MLIPIDTTGSPSVSKSTKLSVFDDPGTGSNLPGGINWVGFTFNQVREKYSKLVDDQFNSNSHVTTTLIGGDSLNINPENWRQWVPTIVQFPEVIKKQLLPLWMLFEDQNIQNQWKTAQDAYEKWWIDNKIYEKDDVQYKQFMVEQNLLMDLSIFID